MLDFEKLLYIEVMRGGAQGADPAAAQLVICAAVQRNGILRMFTSTQGFFEGTMELLHNMWSATR